MLHQAIYHYRVKGYSYDSVCILTIPTAEITPAIGSIPAGIKIIVEEIIENPGMTIINAAEFLANQVAKEFQLERRNITWIEHYPPPPGEKDLGVAWSQVQFDIKNNYFRQPYWKRLLVEEVDGVQELVKKYQ
jgi:hypothetical protein